VLPDIVIQLLEEKKIKKSDFIITENYHHKIGRRCCKVIDWKNRLNFNARCNYKNNKNYSYQIILQDNLQQLANFIIDKKKYFEFNISAMKLNRNVNLELSEKILSMIVEERKRWGINKSTLWYIKII
jgi:CRISPR-associated protein Cas1